MKIGIISDTHGHHQAVLKAFRLLEDTELILHAGDILHHGEAPPDSKDIDKKGLARTLNTQKRTILASKGNCDRPIDQQSLVFDILCPHVLSRCGPYQLLMLHGDDISQRRLDLLIRESQAHIVVTGHSHLYHLYSDDGVLWINPGSTSLPKADNPPSVAVIDLACKKARILAVGSAEILIEKELPRIPEGSL